MMECLRLKETECSYGQVLEQCFVKSEQMQDVLLSTAGLNSNGTHSADLASSVEVISTSQAPSRSSDSNVYSVFMLPQSIKVEAPYYPNEEGMTCCGAGASVLDVEHHLEPAELCTNLLEGLTKKVEVSMLETAKDRALIQDNHCDRKLDSVNEHRTAQLQKTQLQEELSFKCDRCDKTYISILGLSKHRVSHHDRGKVTKCHLCDIEISSAYGLTVHILTHAGVVRPYKCRQCSEGFNSTITRRKHEQCHISLHRLKLPSFESVQCDETSRNDSALRQRRAIHRKNSFKCNKCDRTFGDVSSLREHMAIHRKNSIKCNKCDKTFGSYNSLSHHRVVHRVGDKGTTCKYCGRVLCSRIGLARHLWTHTSERPFKCRHCGKECLTFDDRRVHEERHNTTVQYKCTECNVSFISSVTLHRHNKNKHSDPNWCKCPLCPKWCSSTGQMTKHVNRHKAKDRALIQDNHCDRKLDSVSEHRAAQLQETQLQEGAVQLQETQLQKGTALLKETQLQEGTVKLQEELSFECDRCDKTYTSISGLSSHRVSLHDRDKVTKCHLCDIGISSVYGLTVHILTHAGVVRPYKCRQCSEGFNSTTTRRKHEQYHINLQRLKIPSFESVQCDETSGNDSSLRQHRAIHRKNSFKCNKCDKTFGNGKSLSDHKAVHRVGEKGTTCRYCDRVLSSRTSLARHLLTHTGERPFKCRHCGKGCLTNAERLSHEERHNNTVQYKCTECNVSFISSRTLHRHNKNKHADDPNCYKCPLCPKWYASKCKVSEHMNKHKGDERPFFKCEECGKIFYKKTCLKSHMNVHSGDKPFTCQHCGKSFVTSERLKGHIQMFHSGGLGGGKQRQFTCFDCGKAFVNKLQLIDHINIHNGVKPYTCEICGKSFTRPINLQQHIVIHSGDKPFKCNLCDKAFSWKSHLSSHLRSHAGVKPHPCPQCSKCFTQRSGLRLHMRSIHKTELAYKNSSASSTGSAVSAATVQ